MAFMATAGSLVSSSNAKYLPMVKIGTINLLLMTGPDIHMNRGS